MRRSENGMRESRKSPGAPKNKLLGTNYEDKARYISEEQDVMRSHYLWNEFPKLTSTENSKHHCWRRKRCQALPGFMILWGLTTTLTLKSLRTTGKISFLELVQVWI